MQTSQIKYDQYRIGTPQREAASLRPYLFTHAGVTINLEVLGESSPLFQESQGTVYVCVSLSGSSSEVTVTLQSEDSSAQGIPITRHITRN